MRMRYGEGPGLFWVSFYARNMAAGLAALTQAPAVLCGHVLIRMRCSRPDPGRRPRAEVRLEYQQHDRASVMTEDRARELFEELVCDAARGAAA